MANQRAVALSAYSGLEYEQLLVMFGFVKKKFKQEYEEKFKHLSEAKRKQEVVKLGVEKAKEMADTEHTELTDEGFGDTHFPAGCAKYHLVVETSADNVEETYFDILERVRQQSGFPEVHKISDYFAASENSAFFGNSQQRIGIQQDRVQQFLANIGKFVKELFQMVRELRIIDERLVIYEAADGKPTKEGEEVKPSHAADVSLKSIFTDLVEGGTKNPQSVFGLASQVNFTLLPDLFFNTYVKRKEDVDKVVDSMQYNKSIIAVLKRKLYQYLVWKEKTYAELRSRRRFNVKYLRQHWSIIKLYMAWIKPYLRNIQRLTMNPAFMDSPDIVAAFETSYIEVEFLAVKPSKGYQQVVLATFYFRTRPDMSVRKEYQQGPSHMGRMDMNLRAYAWTPDQVKQYVAMKQREEVELLGLLDSSLTDIMDALGDEFEKYLVEAGEELVKEEPEKPRKHSEITAFSPFFAIFLGFKEIVDSFIPTDIFKGGHKKDHLGSSKDTFIKASGQAGMIYHTYKKAHKMITW